MDCSSPPQCTEEEGHRPPEPQHPHVAQAYQRTGSTPFSVQSLVLSLGVKKAGREFSLSLQNIRKKEKEHAILQWER